MSPFARWFDRTIGSFRSSEHRRRRSVSLRERRLQIEPLEKRHLLAYTVTETGSPGNETLAISKALSDTANLTLTSDAAGDLTISDSGNTFAGGSFTGVAISSNSVVVRGAMAGVVHLVFDLSSNNSGIQSLTIGNLNGAMIPGFDVVQNQQGTDLVRNQVAVTLATATIDTGSSNAADASIDIGYPVVVDAPSVTIKTAQLASDVPGSVTLGSVSGAASDDNLSIDTGTANPHANGGSVTIGSLSTSYESDSHYINNFAVDTMATGGGASGVISLAGTEAIWQNEYEGGPDILAALPLDPFSQATYPGGYETAGSQTFDGPVTLTATTEFASSGGGNITFGSTVDATGSYDLTVNTTGLTDFAGVVGGAAASPDLSSLSVSAGPAEIGGGVVSTVGSQTYAGAVTLAGNATFTSTADSNASSEPASPGITFSSTVDGAFDLIAETDGPIDFVGAVGAHAPLTSLITEGYSTPDTGFVEIGAPINTAGTQTYNQLIQLQSTGSISEGANFAAGTYEVQLQAEQAGATSAPLNLQFSVDGASAGSVTPFASSYANYSSAPLAVTAGTHTVSIAPSPTASGNWVLLKNISIPSVYDFADSTVPAGAWQYDPVGLPWTFTATAGVSGNSSGITAGNEPPPQGSQVAFVQDTGSMSETVSLSAGTYTLNFLAAQRGNYNHGGQYLEVVVDGSPVSGDIMPAGTSYMTYSSAAFTVTAGTHTIEILGLDLQGGDNTALVDSVSLAPATPDQVADPDFVAAGIGSAMWQYAPAGSPWTFSGTAGVSGNYSGITVGNPTSPQGSQVAFVQGTGSVSQTVGMSAGTYTLDFLAAQRENYNHGGQSLEVLVDGAPVGGSITPADTSYALYGSATFTVNAGVHTITIEGLDPSGQDNTALIDAVSLQPVTANQVTDPNFNDAAVGPGNWQYAPADSAWYFLGTAGVSGGSSDIALSWQLAPQGSQMAFVQGTGSINQVVNMAAGMYTLSFMATLGDNDNSGGPSLKVLVDGTLVSGDITLSGNYSTMGTATFIVAAGSHTITIEGLDPGSGGNAALIDAVSLEPATSSQLPDPEFAAVSVGSGAWQYAPSGSSWSFTGTAGISGNSSAITAGNPMAPQGDQVAFVQEAGSMSQTVNLPAGTYTLSFLAAQRENYNHGGQSLQVLVDGTPASGEITPAGTSYLSYSSAAFTVTAGMHTIEIVGLDPAGGDNTALVDEVSLAPATLGQVVDPDFAATAVGSARWQYAPAYSPWTFSGTAGVSGNYSGITAGNGPAPQGSQVAFVQDTGSISQTVGMSAGTYTLDFLSAQRENYNHGGQSLEVLVDGTPVGSSIAPTGSSYALYASASFTVTAGPHTITIEGLDPSGQDNTALIDSVSLQPVTANQVADPDFSAANVSSGTWQYGPADSGWYFLGTAGVSGDSSGITAGNPPAPQGSQVAFVQETGWISQAVSLSAGTYTIQFDAAQRENYNSGGQTLQVSIDGALIGSSITPAGPNFAAYTTATFTVSAGTHVITIAGLDPPGGDNTALIDSVAIVAA